MEKENQAKPEVAGSKAYKLKKFLFGEKNIIATLILALVIIQGSFLPISLAVRLRATRDLTNSRTP